MKALGRDVILIVIILTLAAGLLTLAVSIGGNRQGDELRSADLRAIAWFILSGVLTLFYVTAQLGDLKAEARATRNLLATQIREARQRSQEQVVPDAPRRLAGQ